MVRYGVSIHWALYWILCVGILTNVCRASLICGQLHYACQQRLLSDYPEDTLLVVTGAH